MVPPALRWLSNAPRQLWSDWPGTVSKNIELAWNILPTSPCNPGILRHLGTCIPHKGCQGLNGCVCGHCCHCPECIYLWMSSVVPGPSCNESLDCLMKSLILGRKQGWCTSLTSLWRAHTHTDTENKKKKTQATLRAGVTKAHARRMKMDGNLFTRCFILAHTGQKQKLCPRPILFFYWSKERQCLMAKDPDIYGY